MRSLSSTLVLILILNGLQLPIAHAKEILYKPAAQSLDEFNGLRLARNDAIAFDEYQASHLVSTEMKDNLSRSYLQAQEHFLKSEIQQIETEWRDVTSYAFKADWGSVQREMIQTAYMRLAQLASTPEETRRHLRSAFEFSPDYNPDPKLFPPPLVEQYRQMRAGRFNLAVPTSGFAGFTILLVNGVRYDVAQTDTVDIPNGTKRITFLSPTYAQVMRILEAEELSSFRPQKIILAQARATSQPEKKSETVASLSPQLSLLYKDEVSPENPIGANTSQEKSFYQKPKFWLVSAALLGAALIVNGMQKDEETKRPPSHREGF